MFLFDDDKYYSMPVYFGGSPVRKTMGLGENRSLRLSCAVDPAQVEKYLPEGFSLLSPELHFTYCQCNRVDWLQGGHLNFFEVGLHVRYDGNDEGLTGQLPLVVWTDRVSVLYSFREEAGIPGLHVDRFVTSEEDGLFRVGLGREGYPFCEVEFREGEALTAKEIEDLNVAAPSRQFGWRYIPNTGAPGAALSHATVSPYVHTLASGVKGKGRFLWHPEVFDMLPFQIHILSCLACVPLAESMDGVLATSTLKAMPELARPLP